MPPTFLVIMGVSGCGKTTVAERVASETGAVFLEGDAFHPPENKAKMAAGIPLDDEDRRPWFARLAAEATAALASGRSAALACSALKRSYRDRLFRDFPEHRLVHLEGGYDLIEARMDAREHEYMNSSLLRSQFEALEPPGEEEHALVLSIEASPEEIVREIMDWIGAD